MSIAKVTKSNYQELLEKNEYVVLNYSADWCGPCQSFAPLLLEASETNPNVIVGKINIDNDEELAQQAAIMSIPTTMFIKNGEISKTINGVIPPRLLQKEIESLLSS